MAGWGDLLAQALQGEATSEYKNSPMYQIGGNLNAMQPSWNREADHPMRDYLLQAFTAPMVGTAMQDFADVRIANEMRPRYVSLVNALSPAQVDATTGTSTPSPWLKLIEAPDWNPRLGMVPLLGAVSDWENAKNLETVLGTKGIEYNFDKKLKELEGSQQQENTILQESIRKQREALKAAITAGAIDVGVDDKGNLVLQSLNGLEGGTGGADFRRLPKAKQTEILDSSTQTAEIRDIAKQFEDLVTGDRAKDTANWQAKRLTAATDEGKLQQRLTLQSRLLTKAIEGARPTDYDAAVYKKIQEGDYFSSPADIVALLKQTADMLDRKSTNTMKNYKRLRTTGSLTNLEPAAMPVREPAPSSPGQVTKQQALILMAANPQLPGETPAGYKQRLRNLMGQ